MSSSLSLVFSCVAFFFIFCEGSPSSPHIINGRNARPGEFPYQVTLQRKFYFGGGSYHWCGGTIIGKKHVLTAAHCAVGVPVEEYVVYGGILNISTVSQVANYTLEKIFVHEKFDNMYYFNDIALLKLNEEFDFGDPLVESILLRRDRISDNSMCQVTGWGLINDTYGIYPDILQEVDLPIIPDSTCSKLYDTVDGMKCAGYLSGGKDACSGDSGGPMACEGELTGIVSAGAGCAQPNSPGLYTEVAVYLDWIESRLRL